MLTRTGVGSFAVRGPGMGGKPSPNRFDGSAKKRTGLLSAAARNDTINHHKMEVMISIARYNDCSVTRVRTVKMAQRAMEQGDAARGSASWGVRY